MPDKNSSAVNSALNTLLAAYFMEKAENSKVYATLWAIDPEKYGTNVEGIAREQGRAEAYKEAADKILEYCG